MDLEKKNCESKGDLKYHRCHKCVCNTNLHDNSTRVGAKTISQYDKYDGVDRKHKMKGGDGLSQLRHHIITFIGRSVSQ